MEIEKIDGRDDSIHTSNKGVTIFREESETDKAKKLNSILLNYTEEEIKKEMLEIVQNPKKYNNYYIEKVNEKWKEFKAEEKKKKRELKKRRNTLQSFRKLVDKERYIPNYKLKMYIVHKKAKEKIANLKEKINEKKEK